MLKKDFKLLYNTKLNSKQKVFILAGLSFCLCSTMVAVPGRVFGEDRIISHTDYSIPNKHDNASAFAIVNAKENQRLVEEQKAKEEAERLARNRYYEEIANAQITGGPFRLSLYNHDASTMIANINAWCEGYPIAGLGETFVKVGSAYDVDPYVLVAIATVESGRGVNQANSYNLFGLTNGGLQNGFMAFNSYEESISYLAKTLAGPIYMGSGMTTLEEIGPVYCPSPGGWSTKIANYVSSIAQ